MTYLKALFISPALIGIIFSLASLLQKKFPPKHINKIYGYRTKQSMFNEDKWKLANNYSSSLMLKLSFVLIALGILLAFLLHDAMLLSLITVVSSILCALVIVLLTEKRLKA